MKIKSFIDKCSQPPYWGFLVLLASFLSDTPLQIIYSSIVLHTLFLFDLYPKKKSLKKVFILGILIFSTYSVYNVFKTILDLEAGISLLTFLLSAKVFELKSKRDQAIYYYIGFLVITGITVFNQSFIASILSIILIILGIWGHSALADNNRFVINLGGVSTKNLILYGFVASGILIICYLLFPRINFGFRNNSKMLGQSNFSPMAAPGEVDEIILSDDPVFVAKIKKSKPRPQDLYWVGTILTRTDGYYWREDRRIKERPPTKSIGDRIGYEILLRGQNNEYIFTPDTSLGPPNIMESYLTLNEKTFKLRRATHKKVTYSGEYAQQVPWKQPSFDYYQKKKRYTKAGSRVFDLAAELKGNSQRDTITNVLNYFKDEKFFYTLKPGRTSTMEDFIFRTKKGFCTHFASATALLLRLNDIPTRVIGGFHGGEYNEFGDFYTITGKDAHAWIEYFSKDKGWQRLDPVNIISPERIQLGGQNFFGLARDSDGRALKNNSWFQKQYRLASMYFASLNNDWQRFFYEYDRVKQFNLAKSIGLYLTQLYNLGAILIILLITLLFFLRNKSQTNIKNDKVTKKFLKLIQYAQKKKIIKRSHETASQFLIQIKNKSDQQYKEDISQLALSYNKYQYSTEKNNSQEVILLIEKCIEALKKIKSPQ